MTNSGSQLPMRQQMDSLLQVYANHYAITTYLLGDTGVINLAAADSAAQFDNFQIRYDSKDNMLQLVSYQFFEAADSLASDTSSAPANPLTSVMRRKNFTIQFLNYRYDHYDDAEYDEIIISILKWCL